MTVRPMPGAAKPLEEIAAAVRASPGLRAKTPISLVAQVFGRSDWEAGPGDDGAVVTAGLETEVVGGAAILPAFVQADPFGSGVAAILSNINDLAPMSTKPLALVPTVDET